MTYDAIRNKLNPDDVVMILGKQGQIVTHEQATLILDFLRKLSNIAVSNYLDQLDKESKEMI